VGNATPSEKPKKPATPASEKPKQGKTPTNEAQKKKESTQTPVAKGNPTKTTTPNK